MTLGLHGILLVDKPSGLTSHDVVAKVRRALGTRQVGHAGTLDPMATGLLVVGVGEGRKVLRYLALDDKRYQARIALGVQTDTLDAEGEPEERAAVPEGLSRESVQQAADRFVGTINQRAPRVSALKQAGVPLHARVRRGEQVVAPEREVVVHALEVVAVEAGEITLQVHCGKGFYVRSLARDLALALGTRGHLSALRRSASGHFSVDAALALSQLHGAAREDPAALGGALLTIPQALPDAPCLTLDEPGVDHALHGRTVPRASARVAGGEPATADAVPEGREPLLLCDATGRPLALARAEAAGLRVVRGLKVQ